MNLFDLPARMPCEASGLLLERPGLRIERIVSWGQCSPEGFWYDQEEDEWVCLVRGSALLSFERFDVLLTCGDHLLIPARLRHRVAAASENPPAVWLCAFGHFDSGRETV
ncbi:MAG: phosphoribosylaminoimidazole carboxylase [Oscillospiraceae bacterium]|nr:phosphoribosylaminoimidazole carboxylase [Oscillospiraceae bacterium]MCM0704080.1 phosphoribosylaminoimidazole carboxylase [Faecalicatena sp. BF-R-105]MDY3219781.1 phosphoribosylaminoimidazole carboxylase [Candidatus Fimivivens sp.]SFJ27175.1 cupin 2 domain-containing protein [Ruminococcaceae bacterium D5]GKH52394.1 hypothetical protein CE91St46_35050 [Eubacteriales bacterium]